MKAMAELPWVQWGKISLIGLIEDRYFFNTGAVWLQLLVYLTTESDSTAETQLVALPWGSEFSLEWFGFNPEIKGI